MNAGQPIMCLLIPFSDAPIPPWPGQPPLGIWGGAPIPTPTPPIYYPPQPGAPGVPTHPIYNPPYPSQGPGFPTHPIAPGGPPPGIWPSPGHPAHPIAPGGPPPGIWPSPGHPSHPIVIPPPDWQPPEGVTPPEPGTSVPLPIPGGQPTNPMVVPEFVLMNYPGYGWVAVGKPIPPIE